jgi:hypothetical protein
LQRPQNTRSAALKCRPMVRRKDNYRKAPGTYINVKTKIPIRRH